MNVLKSCVAAERDRNPLAKEKALEISSRSRGEQYATFDPRNLIPRVVEKLKADGVEFIRDIVMHGYGEGDRPDDTGDLEAEFVDPDGNRFLLHS